MSLLEIVCYIRTLFYNELHVSLFYFAEDNPDTRVCVQLDDEESLVDFIDEVIIYFYSTDMFNLQKKEIVLMLRTLLIIT